MLYGPKFNARTGVVTKFCEIAEWTSASGAYRGVLPAFKKARDAFFINAKKHAVSSENKLRRIKM
jgi:hypothetical protein